MKHLVLILSIFLLVGCVTNPPYVEKKLKFKYGNDCLPQAILMTQSLKEKNIDAKVLLIHTKNWGHAICVYMYPKGKNKMWGWDRFWKSMRLRAWKDDPTSVANEWLRVTLSEDKLETAFYEE